MYLFEMKNQLSPIHNVAFVDFQFLDCTLLLTLPFLYSNRQLFLCLHFSKFKLSNKNQGLLNNIGQF